MPTVAPGQDTVTLGIKFNVRALFQTYDLSRSHPGYNNVCYPRGAAVQEPQCKWR